MGELQSLLLVLGAVYLSECLLWVRRGGVAFSRRWGQVWKIWHPDAVLGNARGAFFLGNPLPPLGEALVAYQLPLSLSPKAIFSFTAACINSGARGSRSPRFILFEDAASILNDGKRVLVNRGLFLALPSHRSARKFTQMLRRLKTLVEWERAETIRSTYAETFDVRAIRTRVEAFKEQTRLLPWLSNLLFVYLFVLAPAVLWQHGFRHAGLPLLAGLLAQTISIGWLFRSAHKALFPDGAEDRFAPFLTMLLAPPTAIRARDYLGKHLLEDFHPVAVAQVLAPPAAYQALARHALLDLHWPLLPVAPSDHAGAAETEAWSRALLLDELKKAIKRSGLSLDELLKPPVPAEAASKSYCPRCLTQFVSPTGQCADCGGRELVALK